MNIVLNTSPIIFLSKVDSLKLLVDVSDDIYTPTALVHELPSRTGHVAPFETFCRY